MGQMCWCWLPLGKHRQPGCTQGSGGLRRPDRRPAEGRWGGRRRPLFLHPLLPMGLIPGERSGERGASLKL